ncbi:MAG: bifunctional diaminohydroxyphosphoribosylaminopyrimidine deaminase/5-amino-6-(5-phosphoribosylamino)uracil reductase RibD [Acidobacteriia bacterium]|nr:bifunctional diaminohydroxyphosphoribosylaminopyrimidine deaminase/5-amino-6-(5-phosphoribosylamino)uracil reductase RibD [Methyloceanibacter sp.]MBX5473018.1 bifunctional diaminohydroxyphosphoribosylaminopyrimidine deaminase/5-amino-6-(5-phosphoribosylamino)uracil reductase RibD [Acetobacteraceae bacterium]MCL6492941.1 bifunctional diaminohydroxyphosphoribosylaminopyrimidine deaminase/5-amino-6-(5-phosphoribosylamino)uracil reductase RibD [Terriglobia bacterium]
MHPDEEHMKAALALAERGIGETWPNPSVGCVVVKDGRVLGRGWTGVGGRPHAETQALAAAGAAARGSTVYVTLEPCAHFGQTPPCTEALIAAGVSRVVIGAADPDPRVNGQGVAQLRRAGIEVAEGILQSQAEAVAAGFLMRLRTGRPLVTLKLASTLDGQIATGAGESRWITSEAARRAAHALRGRHDAVLVGAGTVVADDPELTCRLPHFRQRPIVRVVADSHLRIPLTTRIFASAAEIPTWLWVAEGADPLRLRAVAELGVKLMHLPLASHGVDLQEGLRALAKEGITSVLVEGGAQIAAAFLKQKLVDRLVWFHAPAVMGGDGWPAVEALGFDRLEEMPRFVRQSVQVCGPDIMSEFSVH